MGDIRIEINTDSSRMAVDILNSDLMRKLSEIKAIPRIEISKENLEDLRQFILGIIERYATIARMLACCLGEEYIFLEMRVGYPSWLDKYAQIIQIISQIPLQKVLGDIRFRLDLDSHSLTADILNMFEAIPGERRGDLREFVLKKMDNPSAIYGMLLYGAAERYPFWYTTRDWVKYQEALREAAGPPSKRRVVYL